jgi:phosphomannomutase
MSVKKKKLGQLLKDLEAEIGPFHFVRDDVHISQEQRPRIEDALRKEASGTVAGQKIERINRLDGTKYVLEDGSWLLLRLSGRSPWSASTQRRRRRPPPASSFRKGASS